jgi:hypothetical protein
VLEDTVTDLRRRVTVQQESQVGRRTEQETLQQQLKFRSTELINMIDDASVRPHHG